MNESGNGRRCVPPLRLRTAMDAIEASDTPVTFSHDGSYTLASDSHQARRLRKRRGIAGLCQEGRRYRHYRRTQPAQQRPGTEPSNACWTTMTTLVKLVGVDHVAIGTDTSIGDMVGVGQVVMGRTGPAPGALSQRPGVSGGREEHRPRPDSPRVLRRGRREDCRRQCAGVFPADCGVGRPLALWGRAIVPPYALPCWALMAAFEHRQTPAGHRPVRFQALSLAMTRKYYRRSRQLCTGLGLNASHD